MYTILPGHRWLLADAAGRSAVYRGRIWCGNDREPAVGRSAHGPSLASVAAYGHVRAHPDLNLGATWTAASEKYGATVYVRNVTNDIYNQHLSLGSSGLSRRRGDTELSAGLRIGGFGKALIVDPAHRMYW